MKSICECNRRLELGLAVMRRYGFYGVGAGAWANCKPETDVFRIVWASLRSPRIALFRPNDRDQRRDTHPCICCKPGLGPTNLIKMLLRSIGPKVSTIISFVLLFSVSLNPLLVSECLQRLIPKYSQIMTFGYFTVSFFPFVISHLVQFFIILFQRVLKCT